MARTIGGSRLRRAGALFGLALLAGCATTETPPESCPATLAFVKPNLITPYDQLASFIGPDELEHTFTQPIDEMIANSGGIVPAILSGESTVKDYQDILAHEQETRDEYRQLGKDEAWIDLYLNSVRDGVTINQGFVDAVKCRQRQQPQGLS
jgi:hypothetical protein